MRVSDGVPASGLSYTFSGLASATDDLAFSNDGGTSYARTPTPDARGCDPSVTHVRINPEGAFGAATGAGAPSLQIAFLFVVD